MYNYHLQFRNPGAFNNNYYYSNHTYHGYNILIAHLIKIKTFVATEYRQFENFSNYWSNLTVTTTLLTNYCKHSINPRVGAKAFFIHPSNIPFSLTRPSYKPSIYITHTSACVICYSNLLLLFSFLWPVGPSV